MNALAVTKDPEGESGIQRLPLQSVEYLVCESEKKWIVVHTDTDIYYMMGTIKYWEKAIKNSVGPRFEKVDRNTLMNVEKVQLLDRKESKAYFQPIKNNKFCEIAFHKYSKYEQLIKSLNRHVIIQ